MGNRCLYMLALAALMIWGCSEKGSETAGGTDVETSGGELTGIIMDGNGPAAGIVVTLYPDDFNPVTNEVSNHMRKISDIRGKYTFANPGPGNYNILAFRIEDKRTVILQDIVVPDGLDTSISLNIGVLMQPATIMMHTQELALEDDGYLYIPGTGLTADVIKVESSIQTVTIKNVPQATYDQITYAQPASAIETNVLDNPVSVTSSVPVVFGPFHNWSDTTVFTINTSATGADVTGDLIDFPLLIKLDASDAAAAALFESSSDGSDVRFTKSDGVTILNHEIERWADGAGMAEVWVLMDTVKGNHESQNIMMYTGRASVATGSHSQSVFESYDGFLGVWHLNEEGNSQTDGYPDATDNSSHATGTGLGPGSETAAVSANGQIMDGNSDYLTLPPLRSQVTRSITVMHWIKNTAAPVKFEGILMSEDYASTGRIHYQWAADTLRFSIRNNRPQFVDAPFAPQTDTWHHLAMSYRSLDRQLNMYVDGSLIQSATYDTAHSVDLNMPYTVGAWDSSGVAIRFSNAAYDEFRIANRARSSDWIKMSFENQKPGSRVVEIKLKD